MTTAEILLTRILEHRPNLRGHRKLTANDLQLAAGKHRHSWGQRLRELGARGLSYTYDQKKQEYTIVSRTARLKTMLAAVRKHGLTGKVKWSMRQRDNGYYRDGMFHRVTGQLELGVR